MKPGKDYIGVGCGGIVLRGEEVLLVKRSMTSRTEPGYWSRPGGEVEYDETIEEAVAREILEETGVEVRVTEDDYLEHMQIREGAHWIAFGYKAHYLSGEASNLEPDKHDEIRWFPLSELPDKVTEYTLRSLDVLRGRE